MHAAFTLSPDLHSPRRARRFLASSLGAAGVHPDHAWVATVVGHELVTNAVQHARTDLEVRVHVDDETVRVEVSDDNPRRPVPSAPPLTATSGRGLMLVGGLADQWGVEADDDCKTVWFELDRRSPASHGGSSSEAATWPPTISMPRGPHGPRLMV
jgi:anti-sigma regulatory factor (Ser/Thr protein kinase)